MFYHFPHPCSLQVHVKMLLLSLKMGGQDKKVSERDISITRGSAKKWNFIRLKNRWVYSDTDQKMVLFILTYLSFFRNDWSRKLFLVYPLFCVKVCTLQKCGQTDNVLHEIFCKTVMCQFLSYMNTFCLIHTLHFLRYFVINCLVCPHFVKTEVPFIKSVIFLIILFRCENHRYAQMLIGFKNI